MKHKPIAALLAAAPAIRPLLRRLGPPVLEGLPMKLLCSCAVMSLVAACGPVAGPPAGTSADARSSAEDNHRVASAKLTLLEAIGSVDGVRFRNLRDDGMSVCGEYTQDTQNANPGYDKFRYAAGAVMRRSDHERYRQALLRSGHTEIEIKAMLAEFDRFWEACQKAGKKVG